MKLELPAILTFVIQSAAVIATAYVLFRKKVAEVRKSEAETEKTIADNYAALLEEYRHRSKEEISSLQLLYESKLSALKDEILRLQKNLDSMQDELNAYHTISQKRQEDLNRALEQQEYYRGQYSEATRIIDKHITNLA